MTSASSRCARRRCAPTSRPGGSPTTIRGGSPTAPLASSTPSKAARSARKPCSSPGVQLARRRSTMTTLLHVEDDLALADLVQLSFEVFGFHGQMLHAASVHAASEIVQDTTRYPALDLILTDMLLPDGNGLDVVRRVRTDLARAGVPILILS